METMADQPALFGCGSLDQQREAIAATLAAVPGLIYLPDFLDASTEAFLLSHIDVLPWSTAWKRRVQSYGASYRQKRGAEEPVHEPLPGWLQGTAGKLVVCGLMRELPVQSNVNEYLPGQGIAPHVDYDPFGDTVVSISLCSPCVMDFRHRETKRKVSLLLDRLSLLAMTGEARWDWTHGIAPRKCDVWCDQEFVRRRRVSVTFRNMGKPGFRSTPSST